MASSRLWLTGEYLSVPASVGFINLFGVAVLNGIVLVSYFNKLREDGLHGDEAVIKGCTLRLRPVLMTALVALFGLMPLAFAHGIGSEVQRPLRRRRHRRAREFDAPDLDRLAGPISMDGRSRPPH